VSESASGSASASSGSIEDPVLERMAAGDPDKKKCIVDLQETFDLKGQLK